MKYRLGLIDHGFVPRKLTVSYVAICAGEVDVAGLRTAFGLLCDKYPMLRGTIRDHVTHQRRAFVRFFACEQDLSHELWDTPLPEAVAMGKEPFLIVGAMAGG